MKQHLLALAALIAVSASAQAQSSSVTIYGLIDQGVIKGNGGEATGQGLPSNDAWQLGQAATSRLGFRGNEDLGGGLSAQFQIEHRLNPDTGATNSATTFWNGRSFVQLTSASFGAVLLGREYTPAWFIQNKSDPFGNDGVGQAGANALWGDYQTLDPAGNGQRSSNAVVYKTPKLGGLTAQAMVGLGEKAVSGSTSYGRVQGLNVEYADGPLYAGLGYERIESGTGDGRGVTNVAVHYDLGMVKPILYYGQGKSGTNGSIKAKTWMLGATAPLAGGLVKAMYYKVDSDNDANDRTKFGLGYNYPLSKRTNLYLDYGVAKQDDKKDNSAWSLGVKHLF